MTVLLSMLLLILACAISMCLIIWLGARKDLRQSYHHDKETPSKDWADKRMWGDK